MTGIVLRDRIGILSNARQPGRVIPARRWNSPMKTHDGPIFLPFQPSIMVVLLALAGMILLAIPLTIGRLICGGWYE